MTMFLLYIRISRLLLNPVILFFLLSFLRFCFVGVVECYEFAETIYVIDKPISTYRYQCWLVHEDILNYHLGLPDASITDALFDANIVNSSQGEVYITNYIIDQVNWNNLIAGHPELASQGLSCVKTYSTIGQSYAGPRDTALTLDWFLTSYC